MAENNEFFREVDEDYRRDKVAEIWKRYNALIIAAAVLVVAGVAGWRYWQQVQLTRAETASAQFDQANKLAEEGKTAEADKLFGTLKVEGPAGYTLLARFREAADLGKRDAASGAEVYDKLAADKDVGEGLRDLAKLRAALLRLDSADPTQAIASLETLATPTGTYRHTSREMLGLAALRKGDYEAAGRWFEQITADRDSPQGLGRRVEVYQTLVSGGPVTVTEAKPELAAPLPPMTR